MSAPPVRRFVGLGMLALAIGAVAASTWRERLDDSMRVDIPFVRGTDMADGSDAVLGRVASLLRARPDERAYVTGHTDAGGDATADQALSEDRASTVAGALEADGIAATRIVAVGVGGEKPPARNDGESDADWHRRWARVDVRVDR